MGGTNEPPKNFRADRFQSRFSKNRHGRFRKSDLLRRVFEMVLQRCIREGLVGGEGFAVDASLIKADVQYLTAFLGALAEGLAGAGRVAQGLAAIDGALAQSECNEERWCVAPQVEKM